MTKSETQLTLQKAIERFAGKKCKEFEPHCFSCMAWEVLPSWLENEHNTLFTQALTSLKSEMEALKLPVKKHHPDMHQRDCVAYNEGISVCQRVIDEVIKGRMG